LGILDSSVRIITPASKVHKVCNPQYIASLAHSKYSMRSVPFTIVYTLSEVHKAKSKYTWPIPPRDFSRTICRVWLEAVSYLNGSRPSGSRLIPNVFSPLLASLDIQCQIEQVNTSTFGNSYLT